VDGTTQIKQDIQGDTVSHRKYPDRGIIPLSYHHAMLSDVHRCVAFAAAIERIVRAGDVVLDVGAETCLQGYFAVRSGARRVYALEADPQVARAAREYVRLNHLDDRIQVVEGLAQNFTPPEEADVIICEMLHVGLIEEQQVPVLNALRSTLDRTQPNRRYTVIPGAVVNYCQLVDAKSEFHGYQVPMVRFGNMYVADPSITALSGLVPYTDVNLSSTINSVANTAIDIPASAVGTVNAARFVTQVVLWFDQTQPTGQQLIDWFLNFLIVPLEQHISVTVGQKVKVSLNYRFGCPLEELQVRAES
jgi:protein arginine N-methyltransferase 1